MMRNGWFGLTLAAALVSYSALSTQHSALFGADWPTWHGSAARTGNSDGKPGPKTGNVLWAFQPKGEQFIGSPSAAGDRLYFGGVGLAGTFRCLGSDGKPVWELPNKNVPGLDAASLMLQGIVRLRRRWPAGWWCSARACTRTSAPGCGPPPPPTARCSGFSRSRATWKAARR